MDVIKSNFKGQEKVNIQWSGTKKNQGPPNLSLIQSAACLQMHKNCSSNQRPERDYSD